MSFIVKKHNIEKTNVMLAIIDKELLGKKIIEDKKVLDLTSNFYKGEKKTEKEVLEMIKNANHLNVVGKNIVNFLKKQKIVDSFLKINKIPYAQIIIIKD
ncbi:DUF424 family protein [Candidatus Woesearchaeota archaeon]|nr:DUF424 family protein [Candidatus Woesearchaeota archaeon]